MCIEKGANLTISATTGDGVSWGKVLPATTWESVCVRGEGENKIGEQEQSEMHIEKIERCLRND